jgi:ADP-heptose:LPS heptosyltransferase
MSVCFGLASGIGNALFCLPAIKALAEQEPVTLYVDGDYDMLKLFEACRYAERVVGEPESIPKADRYLVGHAAPPRFVKSRVAYKRCGFAYGTTTYQAPEWCQVLEAAAGRKQRMDVSDWWIGQDRPVGSPWFADVALIPGCKPGVEWARKKYPGMADLARALRGLGLKVAIFGRREDSPEDIPHTYDLRDLTPLHEVPGMLRACRAAVGTDSGLTHLAASLNVPTVFVYTATSPVKGDPVGNRITKLWRGLECSPCQSIPRWHQCKDWKCRELPVEEVLVSVLKFL